MISEGPDSIPENIRSIYLRGSNWLREIIRKVYEILESGISRDQLLMQYFQMQPPQVANITGAWVWDWQTGGRLNDPRPYIYVYPDNPTPRDLDLRVFLSMRHNDTPQQTVLNAEKDLQEAERRKFLWGFGLDDSSLSLAIARTFTETEEDAQNIIQEAKIRIDEYYMKLDFMRNRVEELRRIELPGGGKSKNRRNTRRSHKRRRK